MATIANDNADGFSVPYTAPADLPCGTLVTSAGQAGYVKSLEGIASGATGMIQTHGLVDLPIASGVVLADGAPVGFDNSADQVVAAGSGNADFYLGLSVGGSANGETTTRVNLNQVAGSIT